MCKCCFEQDDDIAHRDRFQSWNITSFSLSSSWRPRCTNQNQVKARIKELPYHDNYNSFFLISEWTSQLDLPLFVTLTFKNPLSFLFLLFLFIVAIYFRKMERLIIINYLQLRNYCWFPLICQESYQRILQIIFWQPKM